MAAGLRRGRVPLRRRLRPERARRPVGRPPRPPRRARRAADRPQQRQLRAAQGDLLPPRLRRGRAEWRVLRPIRRRGVGVLAVAARDGGAAREGRGVLASRGGAQRAASKARLPGVLRNAVGGDAQRVVAEARLLPAAAGLARDGDIRARTRPGVRVEVDRVRGRRSWRVRAQGPAGQGPAGQAQAPQPADPETVETRLRDSAASSRVWRSGAGGPRARGAEVIPQQYTALI
mmetsp:Transcript_17250/g.55492  ORF Transcript_17250/g.55492 Transcript_17250/m.55492 type:complete len:232 (+) Transcript_17250:986-1681(+)